MESKRPSFSEQLTRFLSFAEIGALLVILIGLLLIYFSFPIGRQLLMPGFSALAVTYFLTAFTAPQQTPSEGGEQPGGIWTLLAKTILRKILFIGCSVAVIGLLFAILNLTGSRQMLTLGAVTLLGASALCGLAGLKDPESLKLLQGPLLRALPLGLLTVAWLYTH